MSREIKFRGQVLGTTRWVVGFFCKDFTGHCFITDGNGVNTHQVHEETVGEFTGLKDKNGVDVFEGDVVSVRGTKKVGLYITEVIYVAPCFTLKVNNTYLQDSSALRFSEVIGNMHENPELLTK